LQVFEKMLSANINAFGKYEFSASALLWYPQQEFILVGPFVSQPQYCADRWHPRELSMKKVAMHGSDTTRH